MANSEQHKHSARIAASLIRDHRCATPFLFFDESELNAALERFQAGIPNVRIFYAVKANPSPSIIGYFAGKGLSFDVASAGEVELVSGFGVPGSNMFLSTPIKSADTMSALFRREVGAFAVDTASEAERIDAYRRANQHSFLPKVFVRIRVESKHVEVDLNTKFGCSLAEALEIVRRCSELGYEVAGICFHVGTQSTDADNYFLGVRTAMLVAEEAWRRFKVKIRVINIGGGFCDPLTARRAGIDLEEFYRSVDLAVRRATDAGFDVYAEPGRCLVSGAGTSVTSVLGTNVRNGRRWAYLDDGIYGCYSIKLYEKHPFEFYPVNFVGQGSKELGSASQWTVAGPTCDSLDVIAEDARLPSTLRDGDVLLTPNLGAYSISTACNFNGFNRPECHLVRADVKANGKLSTTIVQSRPGRSGDGKVANA